jgi:hypothetical protein
MSRNGAVGRPGPDNLAIVGSGGLGLEAPRQRYDCERVRLIAEEYVRLLADRCIRDDDPLRCRSEPEARQDERTLHVADPRATLLGCCDVLVGLARPK